MAHYQQRYIDNLVLRTPHKSLIGEDDLRLYQLNALQQISGRSAQTVPQSRTHDSLVLPEPVKTKEKVHSIPSNGECALDLTVPTKKRPLDDVYKENVQVKHARYSFPATQHAAQKTAFLQHSRIDLANQSNYIPNGHLDTKQSIANMIYSPKSDIKHDKCRGSLVYKHGEPSRAQQNYTHSFSNVVSSGEGHGRTVLEHSRDSHQNLLHNQQRTISGKRVCNQSIEPSGQVEYVSFRDARSGLTTHNIQHSVSINKANHLTSPNHDYKQNVTFTDANVAQLQQKLQHSVSKKPVATSTADHLYRQNMFYKNKTLSSPDNNFHHNVSMINTTQHSPSHRSIQHTVPPYKDMVQVQSQPNLQYYHSNHIETQPELRGIQSSASASTHPLSRQTSYASLVNNTKPKTGSVHQAFLKAQQPAAFSKLIQQYHNNSVSNNSTTIGSQQSAKYSATLEKYICEYAQSKTSQNATHHYQTNSAQNNKILVGETPWNRTCESTSQSRSSSTRVNVDNSVALYDKMKPQGKNTSHDMKTDGLERLHSRTTYQNMAKVAEKRVPSPRSDCFSMLSDEPNVQSHTHKERNHKQTKHSEEFTKTAFTNAAHFHEIHSQKSGITNERKAELSERFKMQQSPVQQIATNVFPDKINSPRESNIKQEADLSSTLDKVNCHRNAKSVIFDLLTKSNDKSQSEELKDANPEVIQKHSNGYGAFQHDLEISKDAGLQNVTKQTHPKEYSDDANKVSKPTEISDLINKIPSVNSTIKPRVHSITTNISVSVPFSKKRIILDAVSKDKDLCRFIEDTSCVRAVNNVGFNPDSPEMPTLSPQQKLTNSCTISPNLNEPPVLECLDSDSNGKANVTTKIKEGSLSHSTNTPNNNTSGILSDGKGFFKRDTFPRRPSIMKVIPVANVAPMIKNKNADGDDVSTAPERLVTGDCPTEEKDSLMKVETAEEDKTHVISVQLHSDINTSRSVGKKKKRRAASRTKRAKKLDAERQQQRAVKLKSRSDLQRTIRRLKRSTRSEISAFKEAGEDISCRITRSNRSIRLRRSSGSTRLPRYNRNAAYENELKNEQTRNAQRKLKPRRRIRIVYTSREEEGLSEKDVCLQTASEGTGELTTNASPYSQGEFRPKTLKTKSPRTWAQKRGTKRRIRRHFTPRGCARIVQKSEYDTLEESAHVHSARRSLFTEFDASEFNNLCDDKAYNDFVRLQGDIRSLVVNKSLGETLLHKAVRVGNKEIVEYCLERDSHNVNAKDNAGYTPLHEACVTGNEMIALMLLKNGSDINACSQDGIRPIHDAVENHHVSIVRLLLKYGADPTLSNYAGKSPLKLAKTHQMYTFLSGCLDDLNGTEDVVDMWQFKGSSVLDTERESEIFADMPSDPEDESGDVFQFEDFPQFSTIQLNHGKEQSLEEYIFTEDVLSYYKIEYETFQTVVNDCQPFEVRLIPREEVADRQYHHTVHISKLNSGQLTFKMVLKSQWMANSTKIHSKLAEYRKLCSLNSTDLSDVQNNNTIMYDKEAPSQISYNKQQSVAVAPTVRPSVIKLMNRTNSNEGLSVNPAKESSDLLKMTTENKLKPNSMWITSDCYEMDHFPFKMGTVPNDCFDLTSNQNCLKKYTALVRPCKDNTLVADTGGLLDVTY